MASLVAVVRLIWSTTRLSSKPISPFHDRISDAISERILGRQEALRSDGASCRAYAAWRVGKGQGNKGTSGGARRDLQDLAAAINHHAKEGLRRGLVRVALAAKGKARQRWLTRDEAARLLWACWRTREVQEGRATDKRPLLRL